MFFLSSIGIFLLIFLIYLKSEVLLYMETGSRVKKYENLRQEILEDNKDNIEEPQLSRFAKRLSNIDSDHFKNVAQEVKQSNTVVDAEPQRVKTNAHPDVEDTFFNEQEILARALRLSKESGNENDDELLNSFLKEIRTYNQKQGIRSLDDTRLEILKQVQVESGDSEKKDYAVKEDESKNTKNAPSLSEQVQELLKNGAYDESEEATIVEESAEETGYIKSPVIKSGTDRYAKLIDEDRENHARILEETQQLRLKLSEHEDELDEIGSGVDYTRRLLNVLIGLLLITLLIAGGILAYLILRG